MGSCVPSLSLATNPASSSKTRLVMSGPLSKAKNAGFQTYSREITSSWEKIEANPGPANVRIVPVSSSAGQIHGNYALSSCSSSATTRRITSFASLRSGRNSFLFGRVPRRTCSTAKACLTFSEVSAILFSRMAGSGSWVPALPSDINRDFTSDRPRLNSTPVHAATAGATTSL